MVTLKFCRDRSSDLSVESVSRTDLKVCPYMVAHPHPIPLPSRERKKESGSPLSPGRRELCFLPPSPGGRQFHLSISPSPGGRELEGGGKK